MTIEEELDRFFTAYSTTARMVVEVDAVYKLAVAQGDAPAAMERAAMLLEGNKKHPNKKPIRLADYL